MYRSASSERADELTVARTRLEGTRITDDGLKNLSGLTSLYFLHLENTGITNAGLARVIELWPSLLVSHRSAILAMIDAIDPADGRLWP